MFVFLKKYNVVPSDMPYVSLLQFYFSRKTDLLHVRGNLILHSGISVLSSLKSSGLRFKTFKTAIDI